MIWNPIQTHAKSTRHLVFALSQSQTDVLTQPGPWGSAFDGNCIGLAANWIGLQYQGLNFPIDGDVCETPPWQASQAQNLSDAANGTWRNQWEAAGSVFQLGISSGLYATRNNSPSADFLWSIMSQAYGCYGVTLVRSGGAHAIALRHGRDNRYHLFDGNYYHVAMTGVERFKSFVAKYLDDTGYRKRYTSAVHITGITPPIGKA